VLRHRRGRVQLGVPALPPAPSRARWQSWQIRDLDVTPRCPTGTEPPSPSSPNPSMGALSNPTTPLRTQPRRLTPPRLRSRKLGTRKNRRARSTGPTSTAAPGLRSAHRPSPGSCGFQAPWQSPPHPPDTGHPLARLRRHGLAGATEG